MNEGVRKKRGVRTVTVPWTHAYHGLKGGSNGFVGSVAR